jgi:hypothetical protein
VSDTRRGFRVEVTIGGRVQRCYVSAYNCDHAERIGQREFLSRFKGALVDWPKASPVVERGDVILHRDGRLGVVIHANDKSGRVIWENLTQTTVRLTSLDFHPTLTRSDGESALRVRGI